MTGLLWGPSTATGHNLLSFVCSHSRVLIINILLTSHWLTTGWKTLTYKLWQTTDVRLGPGPASRIMPPVKTETGNSNCDGEMVSKECQANLVFIKSPGWNRLRLFTAPTSLHCIPQYIPFIVHGNCYKVATFPSKPLKTKNIENKQIKTK